MSSLPAQSEWKATTRRRGLGVGDGVAVGGGVAVRVGDCVGVSVRVGRTVGDAVGDVVGDAACVGRGWGEAVCIGETEVEPAAVSCSGEAGMAFRAQPATSTQKRSISRQSLFCLDGE